MMKSLWVLGDTHPVLVRLATYIATVLAQSPQFPISIRFDFVRRVVFIQGDVMCTLTLSGENVKPSIAFGYWIGPGKPEPWITGPPGKIIRDIVEHLTRS